MYDLIMYALIFIAVVLIVNVILKFIRREEIIFFM